jgi:5-methylcytosine-specific restriction endonuclease McrA
MSGRRNRTFAVQRQHKRLIAAASVCGICGNLLDHSLPAFDPQAPVVDHIVPVVKGGSEDASNKQVAHRRCNAVKGSKDFAPIIRRSGALK